MIMGSNGAGKSTILDALCFSLYGKAFRKINKPQLVNSVNEKGCLVTIEFSVNETQWKVERGIKPNIFKVYRDGKELDQKANIADQQKWLEQTVLKMNYKSFTQIVILGSSTFVPFMQLPINSRREVVEDLLDIKIFSSMNVVIKEKIRNIKSEIKTLELRKESLIDKVSMQEEFIRQIEQDSKELIDGKLAKIRVLEQESDVKLEENNRLNGEVNNLRDEMVKFEGASDALRKYGTIKGKLSQKISAIVEEHKFFTENTVCPTCEQDIEESFRVNRIGDSQNKAKELQKGFEELKLAIEKEEQRESNHKSISLEVTSLLNGISKNHTQISSCQKQIRDLESEIQTINDRSEDRNSEHDKLESFRRSLQETYEELGNRRESVSYHDFTYSLLKDGGVKSKIIKKYLPLINQQVNKYLQRMDFYINFKLDQEFNEKIETPIHEDFTYASFSEGEKARIDLALILAWREVARFKNSVNTNLILFDEVFDSSLDSAGSEELMKILRYVIKDANVFVITHKTENSDKFSRVLEFVKEKGFSRVVS
jgi:DNA repair exonuclease SbcCD ATPase subunit|tara:strand:+ start:5886 stop:7508 length:1623 start_codon:yes stop_codon:yes gene_type:complete